MTSLEQQLSTLVSQLEQLRDAIPVDPATIAVTLEKHSPGNGSTYTRLRVPKDKALANGKRTMSLDARGVAEWEQKLYARNQQAKVAQCLALVQQAAEVASSITWEAEPGTAMVNEPENFTIDQSEYVVPGEIAPHPSAQSCHQVRAQGCQGRNAHQSNRPRDLRKGTRLWPLVCFGALWGKTQGGRVGLAAGRPV